MPRKAKQSEESFAEQYAELEKIVADFEKSDVNIEEGLQKFERGLQIAGALRKTLTDVENSIEKLKEQYHVGEEVGEGNQDKE